MVLKVEGLCKQYNGKSVLKDICFAVDEAQLVSIIGPSGAGKTTLLKIIAGLENPDAGSIEKQNNFSAILVFQDYVLFPTMNVFDNISFGLRARHENKKDIRIKVQEILKHFGIFEKSSSYPAELSAGQKQRVAIARAMVLSPELLLLDEPFANLDKNLKFEMADFIRKTQKEFKITTLLVTHDLQEAFMISDRIGIMIGGVLCQYDSVYEVYNRPVSLEVADFLGHVNIIPEKLHNILGINKSNLKERSEIYARAESFTIEKDDMGPGIVEEVRFAGHFIIYRVSIEDWICTVYRIHGGIRAGDRVKLRLNIED